MESNTKEKSTSKKKEIKTLPDSELDFIMKCDIDKDLEDTEGLLKDKYQAF